MLNQHYNCYVDLLFCFLTSHPWGKAPNTQGQGYIHGEKMYNKYSEIPTSGNFSCRNTYPFT